jgi:hypothetical protein
MRQLWVDNTAVIASAVFDFPRAELLEILHFVRLEAPSSLSSLDQEQQQQRQQQETQEQVSEQALNAAVRQHIRFLASIY